MVTALFKFGIRNVLRNKRRSAITLASVIIGVAALLFVQSLIKTLNVDMADRVIGIFTSHLQIQAQDSQDPKVPERSFGDLAFIEDTLRRDTNVEAVSKRLVFRGLLASAVGSKAVVAVGVDPQDEARISPIARYVKRGNYLNGENQIILGAKIAKDLDLRVGEKAVIMAQNREGSFEGRPLRVAGIFETGSYTWDASIVYMPRDNAQALLAWGNEVNVMAVKLKDADKLRVSRDKIDLLLRARRKDIKVLTWMDVSGEIYKFQEFQNSILAMVVGVVFMIVTLGVLNTMLMSLFERVREFGLMMALGVRSSRVGLLLLVESAFLGAFGLFWGALCGLSLIFVFHFIGLPLPLGEAMSQFLPYEKTLLMRFAWPSHLFAALLIILVSCIAGVLPALRVGRLRPSEALRHV